MVKKIVRNYEFLGCVLLERKYGGEEKSLGKYMIENEFLFIWIKEKRKERRKLASK